MASCLVWVASLGDLAAMCKAVRLAFLFSPCWHAAQHAVEPKVISAFLARRSQRRAMYISEHGLDVVIGAARDAQQTWVLEVQPSLPAVRSVQIPMAEPGSDDGGFSGVGHSLYFGQ